MHESALAFRMGGTLHSGVMRGAALVVLTAVLIVGCDSGGAPGSNEDPNANFRLKAIAGEAMTYTFDASDSYDADGQISSYQWKFGDGETGSGENVTHAYTSSGERKVGLTVTDDNDATASMTKTITIDESAQDYEFDSDYAYNVNVIYFVPEGIEPLSDYRERLSGFLLYIQDYYRNWMGHWGYDKTFGLLKDQGRVKITRINGEDPVSGYPNDGGGYDIREEVRAYFETHDETPDSKHYLVFTPKPNSDLDLPYYAIGRWGFVSDVGQKEGTAEHQGGGVVHELGHALNLPHNAHPVSRKEELGAAIMHNGNNVWNHRGGASATSLTEVSADILSEAQVFSREEDEFYGPADVKLKSGAGTYHEGEINISGAFESDVPVQKAFVMLDPEGNATYDQHGFAQALVGADSFHVSVPTSELSKTQDIDYKAKVWLVPRHHGRIYTKLTDFSFEDGVPNIDFQFGTAPTIAKEEWEVTDYSDQEPTENSSTGNSQVAANIIDGDRETFWHSRYSDGEAPLPHYITVDMGTKHEATGFQFVQREGISAGAKRVRTEDLEVRVSNDGEDFQRVDEYTLENTGRPQQVELSSPQTFRYFKLVFKSSFDADPRTSMAEVGVIPRNSGNASSTQRFRKPDRHRTVLRGGN